MNALKVILDANLLEAIFTLLREAKHKDLFPKDVERVISQVRASMIPHSETPDDKQ